MAQTFKLRYGLVVRMNFRSFFFFNNCQMYLSPPQRPLCIVGRLLCCGEAGEKEKESARGTPFPSSHRSPRAFYFCRLLIFWWGYPAGASAEERGPRPSSKKNEGETLRDGMGGPTFTIIVYSIHWNVILRTWPPLNLTTLIFRFSIKISPL